MDATGRCTEPLKASRPFDSSKTVTTSPNARSTSQTQLINQLEAQVAKLFNASIVAHDVSHLRGVAENALRIASEEACSNDVVILTAAYLHDVHRE